MKPIKLPRDWSNGQECWLKTELVNCFFEEGVTIGSIMHYDCKDNHNCGGSFVKFQVCLKILNELSSVKEKLKKLRLEHGLDLVAIECH